jgi:tetratricopeptide (TPR) repeat protein
MPRLLAAVSLLALLMSGAARADEYEQLLKDCTHPSAEPDKAIHACPPLAEMQGAEASERAVFYGDLAVAYQVKGDDNIAVGYFDKALRLAPDFWSARAGRLQSDLMRFDLESAVADFDLLAKMDIANAQMIKLPLGVRYKGVQYHVADDGTVTTPADQTPQSMMAELKSELAHALTTRCATRAANKAFESALADCNLAFGYDPGLLQARGLRGYIEFQQRQFPLALADLDAVVAANPKAAAAIYTRGVVKRRMGDAKGGDADIQAALALEPNVANNLKPKGVTP